MSINFSDGTDHGESAPMFLFGKPVAGGVTGNNPQLPQIPTANDNLDMEFDFRSVYASVLRDWFCVPQNDVPGILLHEFPYLNGMFESNLACTPSDVHDVNQSAGKSLLNCRPNPFRSGLTLDYESAGGMTLVQVLDASGRLVATPVSTWQARSRYQEYWDAGDLPPGTYFCRLVTGGQQQTKTVVKVE